MQAAELDPTQEVHSNCFTIVGTKYAGTYPEVDRAGWFTVAQAERKLLAGQRPLLRDLVDNLTGHGRMPGNFDGMSWERRGTDR